MIGLRKDAFLRCRRDVFVTKDWPEMVKHLADEHDEHPDSAHKAFKDGLILFNRTGRANKLRKPFRKKGKRKGATVPSTARRGVKASVTMQEIIIPVYLRIPIAIGSVSIVETIPAKETK